MRLWSIHPKYLDAKGLVALWREGLLAQDVLKGKTRGYRHHPQLDRFKQHPFPLKAIADYLNAVWSEAYKRGYQFDQTKISQPVFCARIKVTRGQLRYEFDWLCQKLRKRNPLKYKEIKCLRRIASHPLFLIVAGDVAPWEKVIKGK